MPTKHDSLEQETGYQYPQGSVGKSLSFIIDCDQVLHLNDAISRYLGVIDQVHGNTDWRIAARIALITDIMSVLYLDFKDASAVWNCVSSVPGIYKIRNEWKDKESAQVSEKIRGLEDTLRHLPSSSRDN